MHVKFTLFNETIRKDLARKNDDVSATHSNYVPIRNSFYLTACITLDVNYSGIDFLHGMVFKCDYSFSIQYTHTHTPTPLNKQTNKHTNKQTYLRGNTGYLVVYIY